MNLRLAIFTLAPGLALTATPLCQQLLVPAAPASIVLTRPALNTVATTETSAETDVTNGAELQRVRAAGRLQVQITPALNAAWHRHGWGLTLQTEDGPPRRTRPGTARHDGLEQDRPANG